MAWGGFAMTWPVEDVPDSDKLFRRAHRMFFKEDRMMPGVFQEKEGAISVSWERYATAQDARAAVAPEKRPSNAILSVRAGQVREIVPLRVLHEPLPGDRAHSGIHGVGKDPEYRLKLLNASVTEIALDAAVDDAAAS